MLYVACCFLYAAVVSRVLCVADCAACCMVRIVCCLWRILCCLGRRYRGREPCGVCDHGQHTDAQGYRFDGCGSVRSLRRSMRMVRHHRYRGFAYYHYCCCIHYCHYGTTATALYTVATTAAYAAAATAVVQTAFSPLTHFVDIITTAVVHTVTSDTAVDIHCHYCSCTPYYCCCAYFHYNCACCLYRTLCHYCTH